MANSIQRIEGGGITLSLTAAAVAQYKRVKQTSTGAYSVCGLTDFGDAILEVSGDASATGVPARLVNAPGEQFGVASGAVASPGLTLYSAADGCVSTTQGESAVIVGKSASASADGAIVKYRARSVA